VARKYYAKLFREYCIADLSRYKVIVLLWLLCQSHPPARTPMWVPPASRCTACPGESCLRPSPLSAGREGRAAVAHREGGGGRQGAIRVRRARLRCAAGARILRGVQHCSDKHRSCAHHTAL
jgi:Folate-sensitive fragile site protein Fra10Ac1